MPYSTAGKNAMLNALGALAVYTSLHSANPGDNGANELSGGSPAYARKAIAWESAAAGSMNKNASPAVVFDVPASSTVLYVGFWSAISGGTFYGAAFATQEDFGGQGTYTLTDADLNLNA